MIRKVFGIMFSLLDGSIIKDYNSIEEEDIHFLDGKFLIEFDYEDGIRVIYTTMMPMFLDLTNNTIHKHISKFKSRKLNINFLMSLFRFLNVIQDGKQNVYSKIYNPSDLSDLKNYRSKKTYNDLIMFDTCFENVLLLPPYSKITIHYGKITNIESYDLSYCNLNISNMIINITRKIINSFTERFLFLSAGYDSRVMYDILCTNNLSFSKFTGWDKKQMKFVSNHLTCGTTIPYQKMDSRKKIDKMIPFMLEYDGMVNFLDLHPYLKFDNKIDLFLSGTTFIIPSLLSDLKFLGFRLHNQPLYRYLNFFNKSFDAKVGINRNIFSYSPFEFKCLYRNNLNKKDFLEEIFKDLGSYQKNKDIGFLTTSNCKSDDYIKEEYNKPIGFNVVYSFLLYLSRLYENEKIFNKIVTFIMDDFVITKKTYLDIIELIVGDQY